MRKRKVSTDPLHRRYARLTAQLAKIELILQGTITERTIVRDNPRNSDKKKTYGPYYQWTWKQHGKTVTVNLSASQAKAYQAATENHRRMENILQEMRDLSLTILEATTQGVKKRKPRQSQD